MTLTVLWVFLTVLWVDLQCVICSVVPDHPNFLRLLSANVSVMETNVSQSGHFNVKPSQHALQGSSYFGNYERSRQNDTVDHPFLTF